MVPLGLWFALALPGLELASHAALVAWIRQPMTAILLALTVTCLVYHSWLGIRVVLEDYVGGEGAKLIALLVASFAHVFVYAVCLFAILKIAFGAPA
jgi:succinate dehydrogenase / fumarate reductase membrane anchor subunit